MTESEYQASLSLEGRTEEKRTQSRPKPEQGRPEPDEIPENSMKIEETEGPRIWDTPYYTRPLWAADERLPPEINEINETIWKNKYRYHDPQNIRTDEYRYPDTQEVSAPRDFMFQMKSRPQPKHKEREHKITLPHIDESMEAIERLKKKYQNPQQGSRNKERKDQDPSDEELQKIRQKWHDEFQDILQGVPEELPPLREVNHEIHLIDPEAKYRHHLPKCPASVRTEFQEKLNRYVNAGWWVPATGPQAAPLMCIPKKDGRLRTVVDARQRNSNTIKDLTPLPDQEIIREDVANARFKSKIDLADAYEQVRVEPRDVPKTLFATVMGTYNSNVVQQGDCNAPATFQRLMTSIFRDIIGRFMHVYLDDIFIYSNTPQEHQNHIRAVLERLRNNHLFLKWKKCELYAKEVECLGHIIDENGIHPDSEKMNSIACWRTPRSYNDVQRFAGLVNYVSNFLPNVTAYSGPLMSMTQNGTPFFWRPIHDKCFEMIKAICRKTPVLKPINEKSDDPIWVICDASKTGVGAMYGQGMDWTTCRPAGLMSKKFSSAQQHYSVHEMETLAILEALHKWEDKLVGRKIHVITDHKALEFFKTQSKLSSRQYRWMDYMSRFDFDITYVKGEYNKVADCLSRYYESDNHSDVHELHEFVNVDRKLDPGGDDLPSRRLMEIKERTVEIAAMRNLEMQLRKKMKEREEQRDVEAKELLPTIPVPNTEQKNKRAQVKEETLADSLGRTVNRQERPLREGQNEEDRRLLQRIRNGYVDDKLFRIVLEEPDKFPHFSVREGVIYKKNLREKEVICVPRDKELITQLLTAAHETLGHFGDQRTCEYVRRWYWWPMMTKNAWSFCQSCERCQRAKTSNQKPPGKLHPLPVPYQPWESIGMDFVGPFPESGGYNYLWVVVCRLTSMVHLIPVNTEITAKELSWKYLREVVRLHGLPRSIVSDRDSKFTSKWWKELHKMIGTQLLMSTSFHPQTDGQTERMNRNIGQILRTTIQPNQKDWIEKIDLVEFAINSSVSSTTGYAPFELNHGYTPKMLQELRNPEALNAGVQSFAKQALANIATAHDAIIEARTFQTFYANKRRGEEPEIKKGDLVYLSTKNLNLPKNRARKLCPKFVGPYKVTKTDPEKSNYTLELPSTLQKRRVHPKFHVSLLKPHIATSDAAFPNRMQPEPYDFGIDDDHEWFVDEIIGHRWKGKKIEYEVRWSLGDTTWEPHANCDQLAALDRYMELKGVQDYSELQRRT
jgi:hypothetical protein